MSTAWRETSGATSPVMASPPVNRDEQSRRAASGRCEPDVGVQPHVPAHMWPLRCRCRCRPDPAPSEPHRIEQDRIVHVPVVGLLRLGWSWCGCGDGQGTRARGGGRCTRSRHRHGRHHHLVRRAELVKDRRLADQWTSRDRPVLIEVVRRFDDDDPMVSVGVIDATRMTDGHVVRAGRHSAGPATSNTPSCTSPPSALRRCASPGQGQTPATPSTDCSGRSRNASQRHVPKRRAG